MTIWRALIIFLAALITPWLAIAILNAMGGCYPWSPKTVPYHEGMTVCPGQAVTVELDGHHFELKGLSP